LQKGAVWSRRKEAEQHYYALHPPVTRPYPNILCEELHSQRVLIVGYGAIGRAIEERLQPFGPIITRIARTARDGVHSIDHLPELLPSADIVVLIVPFTSETTGLIGAKALHNGRISAAIDVTDPEPLPDGHPLWSAPNLLITPHIASSTPQFMVRAMQFAAAQIGRYLRGEPLENIVTGEY
jgi:phosphoglycerate dehydrogenase-like enzyme